MLGIRANVGYERYQRADKRRREEDMRNWDNPSALANRRNASAWRQFACEIIAELEAAEGVMSEGLPEIAMDVRRRVVACVAPAGAQRVPFID